MFHILYIIYIIFYNVDYYILNIKYYIIIYDILCFIQYIYIYYITLNKMITIISNHVNITFSFLFLIPRHIAKIRNMHTLYIIYIYICLYI